MSSNADDTDKANGVEPSQPEQQPDAERSDRAAEQPAESDQDQPSEATEGGDSAPEQGEGQAATEGAAEPQQATDSEPATEQAQPAESDEPPAEEKPPPAEEPSEDEPEATAEAEPADQESAEGAAEPQQKPAAKPDAAPAKAPAAPEDFEEDGRADQALDFVVDVLTAMAMDCTVDLMENHTDDPASDIRIEITGKDADRLIGKKGQTLAALQFLTNRVINRPSKPRRHILIDSDGYRARREHALASMALRLAKQAVKDRKIITFEPMSAQDRRVVHLALAKYPGVVTKSEGKGATRRVQIIPVRD